MKTNNKKMVIFGITVQFNSDDFKPHSVDIELTPNMALELLSKMMKNQRPLSEHNINKILKAINENRWKNTGDPIHILVPGTEMIYPKSMEGETLSDILTINGNHRLTAIVRSGKSANVTLRFENDSSIIPNLDGARPRKMGDHLIVAEEGNSVDASISNIISQLENKRSGTSSPSFDETLRILNNYPMIYKKLIPRKIEPGINSSGAAVRAGVIYASKFLNFNVKDFCEGIVKGNVQPGDPRYALRSSIASASKNGSTSGTARYNLACKTVRACYAYSKNEELHILKDSYCESVLDWL